MRTALGILWLIAIATAGVAQSGGGYDLSWGVISGGGVTFNTGGSQSLGSSIGQPTAIGANPLRTWGNFDLTDGFWFVQYTALSGRGSLRDFGGDFTLVPVDLRASGAGNPTPLPVHVLDASGGCSLIAPLDGIYDLSAKASHWLRQKLAGASLSGMAAQDSLSHIKDTGGTRR